MERTIRPKIGQKGFISKRQNVCVFVLLWQISQTKNFVNHNFVKKKL